MIKFYRYISEYENKLNLRIENEIVIVEIERDEI